MKSTYFKAIWPRIQRLLKQEQIRLSRYIVYH